MAGRNAGNRHFSRIRALRVEAPVGLDCAYDRQRDLPRLLPVMSDDISGQTPVVFARLMAMLRRALRAERVRARAGHWTYDPGRHAALLRAFRCERQAYQERLRFEAVRQLARTRDTTTAGGSRPRDP